MKILTVGSSECDEHLKLLRTRRWRLLDELSAEVSASIQAYRSQGEAALLRSAQDYDEMSLTDADLWVDPEWIKSSHKKISTEVRKAIDHAHERILRFQEELKVSSFQANDEAGVFWGTEVRPLERVGIYVPGGSANYFMTLLLCGAPARAAGVKEIVVATPPRKNLDKPYVDFTLLYCAKLLKIEKILLAGGVGALSALAFGTSHSQPVQKIVGSGGRRTAVSKLLLSGYVGIDGLSGPIETAFVCDKTTKVSVVAADIVGRADHDPQAEIWVFHPKREWLEGLVDELATRIQQLKSHGEQSSIRSCLETRTSFFQVKNTEEAIDVVNDISPGVVVLPTDSATKWMSAIRSCGSVLLGHYTPAVGLDLIGAPSGLVNTLGTAAYSLSMSPMSFVRRFTLIEFDRDALNRHEIESLKLAKEEGFSTHGASFSARSELEK